MFHVSRHEAFLKMCLLFLSLSLCPVLSSEMIVAMTASDCCNEFSIRLYCVAACSYKCQKKNYVYYLLKFLMINGQTFVFITIHSC